MCVPEAANCQHGEHHLRPVALSARQSFQQGDQSVSALPAGALARRERADELVTLLEGLPGAEGHGSEVMLAVLAVRCFGDAHALDQSQSLGRSGARLAALL